MKGGSGKVVDSKPNDRIFLYYSDHGGPGVLGQFSTTFFPFWMLNLYALKGKRKKREF